MKNLILLSLLISSAALAQTTKRGFDTTFYGFIKASSTYAGESVGSYNNINLSAPTHAVAQTRTQDRSSRMSFQTQQSRMGVDLKKESVSGKIEFDFIDFNKSTPTTQMNPRVRIASITKQLSGHQKIVAGQDWDLFSPVTSYTFDFVGLYFMAGNTGFMRQQLQYLEDHETYEWGAALGLAGNNPGTSDSDLETTKTPTLSSRYGWKLSQGRLGVSAIYSQLQFSSSSRRRHEAYGFNLYYEQNFAKWQFKSEGYFGQNMANLGLLSIGKGTANADRQEWGGTLTGTYALQEDLKVFGGIGGAYLMNTEELSDFNLKTTGVIDNPGVIYNLVTRIGVEKKLSEDLLWVSEVSRMQTKSQVSGRSQVNIVPTVETGLQLIF